MLQNTLNGAGAELEPEPLFKSLQLRAGASGWMLDSSRAGARAYAFLQWLPSPAFQHPQWFGAWGNLPTLLSSLHPWYDTSQQSMQLWNSQSPECRTTSL